MTVIKEWLKSLLRTFTTSPEGNAWDELKRARSMEKLQANGQSQGQKRVFTHRR